MFRKKVKTLCRLTGWSAPAVAMAIVMALTSCAVENDPADEPISGENVISGIAVTIEKRVRANDATRAGNDAEPGDGEDPSAEAENPSTDEEEYEIVGDIGNGEIDYTKWDPDELTPYELKFDESSVIQVSQKTRYVDPFQTDASTYSFSYIKGSEGASWDDENSYNFSHLEDDDPLQWNKIGENGSWNGGFGLFSLYFPIENNLRQKPGDNGTTLYSVMQDQSTIENLKKSDILGAYHTSPRLFSRIRFRLFHLMTYVRIRLYVPVYDDELKTGYRENGFEGAEITNVTTDFAIDWNAIRSSDTQGPAVSPLDGDGQIQMYQHPLPDGQEHRKIMKIKYNDFLGSSYPFKQGITGDYDKVRVYDFSVIIPLQKGMLKDDGTQGSFAESEFLNFYFRSNSGALTRYYFTQSLSADTNTSSLELNQGVYQYLQLYLPRVGNQAVAVGASVKPWDQMGTDMLLTPEEDETSQQ